MYLVMKLIKWEDMHLEQAGHFKFPFPVQFVKPEKEVGYCIVFKEYEDALEYAGNPDLIFAIQEIGGTA